jgi:RNA 2',3'-cyclic 3'-phosphodiesterase
LGTVAKERPESLRVRLFTAIDLPEEIRGGLAVWQGRECGDPALRPVAEDALHVTLCFLGCKPERAIGEAADILASLAPRPVELRLEPEPIGLKGRRPGLFALDAPSEEAAALQAELADRLAENRLYEPEKRPFWPHVTIARVKRDGRKPQVVEQPPGPLPDALTEPFGAVRVALYRSHLRSSGARYERLATLQLPPATSGRER